jgi:Protein of unknown function (DUF3455)
MRPHKSTALTIIATLIVLGANLAAAQTAAQTSAQPAAEPKASPTAATIPPPTDAPSKLAVPAGLELVLSARGVGSQIYTCEAGAEGAFSWTFKAPEAELRDKDGKPIGQHFAGPTWKLNDGSEVTARANARVDSLEANSIPWLVGNAISHGDGKGLLTKVTTIQRLHTHGGKPPAAGCDEAHKDAETKSGYTADYYFYAPKP